MSDEGSQAQDATRSRFFVSLLGVLLLYLLSTLPALGARQLWAPNEPNHAEAAREMVADGQWLLPHINGEPYIDKPPLLHWCAALLWKVTGSFEEGWARLPSVLGGLLGVIATLGLGRRLLGLRGGLWSGFVLATTGGWLWQARWVEPDALFAGLIAMSIWCFLEGWSHRSALLPVAGLFLGLALLTKGPVAFLPFLLAAAPAMLRPSVCSWKGRAAGLVLLPLAALGLPVLWVVLAKIHAGYDLVAVLQEQVIDRGTKGLHHVRPWWYYFRSAPLFGLPWFLLLLVGLRVALPSAFGRDDRASAMRMLLLWLIGGLLLFSITAEKRGVYILPLFPAGALLCAAALEALRAGTLKASWCRWPLGASAVLLFLPGLLLPFAARKELPDAFTGSLLVSAILLAGAALGLFGFLRSRLSLGWISLGVATGLAVTAVSWAAPAMDAMKGPRDVALQLNESLEGREFFFYGNRKPALNFYGQLTAPRLGNSSRLEEQLDRVPQDEGVLLVIEPELLKALQQRGFSVRIEYDGKIGRRAILLARVLSPPEPAAIIDSP